MTFSQAVMLSFRHKSFRFYGRSSRHEFWYFYLACLLLGIVSAVLVLVPVVGSLLLALGVLYLCFCQISAMVRRLHDCNRSGKIVVLPFILLLVYFIARIPLHALYQDYAELILKLLLLSSILCYVLLLLLCCQKGSVGSNRYGTDPLDQSVIAQDFINPEHLVAPEYLGDPWRKFKAKYQTPDSQHTKTSTAPHDLSARENTTTTSKTAPAPDVTSATPTTNTGAYSSTLEDTAKSSEMSTKSAPLKTDNK